MKNKESKQAKKLRQNLATPIEPREIKTIDKWNDLIEVYEKATGVDLESVTWELWKDAGADDAGRVQRFGHERFSEDDEWGLVD